MFGRLSSIPVSPPPVCPGDPLISGFSFRLPIFRVWLTCAPPLVLTGSLLGSVPFQKKRYISSEGFLVLNRHRLAI